MIKKAREKSVRLLTVEAGARRTIPNHPSNPQIEGELGRLQAGYRGEQALDYYLTFLPHEDYLIFHGLRLEDHKNRFFQMDTLLLSSTHGLILDSKNISGELEFDEISHQLKRKSQNGYETFGDPISQVERQKLQLGKWMEQHFGKRIPIAGQVVLTNKNSTLIGVTPALMKKVTFLTNLPNKIKTFHENFQNPFLYEKELRKIARTLIKKHVPDSFDFSNFFGVNADQLVKGVICPQCTHAPMIKLKSGWFCDSCGCCSKTAHLDALMDYSLLIGKSITNSQAREFLCLPSRSAVGYIFRSMKLQSDGQGKGSVYLLDGINQP
ncbi:NERD domain-containing protein [Bacillus tianshenii]|uniref:nuclease-related domain-containing protein n=1 Tax=Sutcliffiella tianshenii TaxID=1463404 RepID=UPI001CD3539E|nr:nuclease-related domain-containing protein [Bacillus tianshenii]MCA1320507.1 NERD domain-containing protein [Bacillus tianshenii]